MCAQAAQPDKPSGGDTLRLSSVEMREALTSIGRYELISELGAGAMARVYLARDPNHDGSPITVAGSGRMGIIAAYVALLDERIGRVILHHPPLSHDEAPIFLNIMRYVDIPEALAMLAPRELVFLSDEIKYFDYTKSIYELYGAAGKFRRCYTVAQALNQQ